MRRRYPDERVSIRKKMAASVASCCSVLTPPGLTIGSSRVYAIMPPGKIMCLLARTAGVAESASAAAKAESLEKNMVLGLMSILK